MSFYKLGIKHDLVYNLQEQNIHEPRPIQSLTIPPIMKNKNVIGEAQTGTGKTLAFLLPIFQRTDIYNPTVQTLIIAPTRELALQITQVAKSLNTYTNFNILAIYGGQDVNAQLHKFENDVHIAIGTPGRILDHLKRGTLDLSFVQTVVIDEADEIIKIGFLEDLESILSYTGPDKQLLCFSATITPEVEIFSKTFIESPVMVVAPKKVIALENITQVIVDTSNRRKFKDFLTLVKIHKPKKAIIFCRSRTGVDELYQQLKDENISVACLHGGLTQSKREWTMEAFRQGDFNYLVATDVAARGIDVVDISHVFNYNLPDDPENYVHRIGRTGRAEKLGTAFTLLTLKDHKRMDKIQEFIGQVIDRINFEPKV